MDKKLIALVNILIATEISKISLKEGPVGPRGFKGRDGNDFNISDHEETLKNFIKDNARVELTPEQLESLVGPQGVQGPKGQDGTSVYIEDVLPHLTEKVVSHIDGLRDELKLKFSDLSDDEKEQIRGKRGQRGQRGIDFDFEDSREEITNIISKHIDSLRDSLKLKFDDLSDDEKYSLRGPKGDKGERGEQGSSLSFEECKEEISEILLGLVESKREEYKMKFSDLSEDERELLKLKFDDLTYDEKKSLRGKRGQIGRPGQDGEKGERGSLWLTVDEIPDQDQGNECDMALNSKGDVFVKIEGEWKKQLNIKGQDGIHGLNGINGRDGLNGKNGLNGSDGASIVRAEVDVDHFRKEYTFKFYLDNGTIVETNAVEIPVEIQQINKSYSYYGGGGRGTEGGSSGESHEYVFSSDNFFTTTVGSTTSVALKPTVYNSDDFTVEVTPESINVSSKPKQSPLVFDENDFNLTELPEGKTGISIIPKDIPTVKTTVYDPDDFVVTETQDQVNVSLKEGSGGGGGVAEMSVSDEGSLVSRKVENINFVGDNVTVRARTTMSKWETLSEVTPSLLDYVPQGDIREVDVFINLPDHNILLDILCSPDVYVGAFVYIDDQEMARNANASSYATSNVIGVVEQKIGVSKCNIRVTGVSNSLFQDLDPAMDYYLSDEVDGEITTIVPSTSGHIKLKLGQSFGKNKFLLQKGERVVRL